jgi:hypothetical protein
MEARMKTCSQCKIVKSSDQFFKHKQTKDGLHSWCKACCNIGNQKSRDKVNSTIEGRAKIFLQNAKKSAVKRKQVFELEIKDIVDCWNRQTQTCAYSGREMTLKQGELNTVSIERIDSKVGYTKDNTILVCNAVNRMKSDFDLHSFVSLCKDISKFLKGTHNGL